MQLNKDAINNKQKCNLLNLPLEIIDMILYQITSPYIDKAKKANTIFKLFSLKLKPLKKDFKGILLSSQILRTLALNQINKIKNIKIKKEEEFINKIKNHYSYLTKDDLNNKLLKIINQSHYILPQNIKKAIKLILAGADVNLQNNWNENILILSSFKANKNSLKILLKQQNININLRDNEGWSALTWATYRGKKDIIKLLLNNGANINNKNNIKNTPLMFAVYRNYKDIVKLLLNYGADIYQKNKYGSDVFILAKRNNNNEILILLESAKDNNKSDCLIY